MLKFFLILKICIEFNEIAYVFFFFLMIYIEIYFTNEAQWVAMNVTWALSDFTCICSYECFQSRAIQIQCTHWTNWQICQFIGSDLPIWMLACVNVSFNDSLWFMEGCQAFKLCVTVCSKPPAKTLFSSMKCKDAKRSL